MPAGDLRERLRFESPKAESDDAGNQEEGWAPEFTTWARVKPLRGGETVQAARLEGRQPVIVTVRRSTNARRIKSDWRAVDVRTGAIYQLKSPATDTEERRLYLDILAESGVAA